MARRTAVVWAAEDTAASLHAQYRTEPVRVQRLCGWGWIREALKDLPDDTQVSQA